MINEKHTVEADLFSSRCLGRKLRDMALSCEADSQTKGVCRHCGVPIFGVASPLRIDGSRSDMCIRVMEGASHSATRHPHPSLQLRVINSTIDVLTTVQGVAGPRRT